MQPESDLLRFAIHLAEGAGKIAMKYYGGDLAVELKGDSTPVTIADRQAEEWIRAEIGRECPGHGVVGEEFGATNPESEFQWVIDPIDGTKSFIRGVPLFGVMVALEQGGRSRIGVIHHPPLGMIVAAEAGGGTRLNGKIVRVAEAAPGTDALVTTTSHSTLARVRPEFFAALLERFPFQRGWGDCFGYTLVATGRAQAALDPVMNRWDIAALIPIIEEAGGVVTDFNGLATGNGTNCIAAEPRTHAAILELARRFPKREG